MEPTQEIAIEAAQYLQTRPLSPDEFAAQHEASIDDAPQETREVLEQELPSTEGTRGLGDFTSGLVHWAWSQLEPLIRQQICAPETKETLQGISTDELAQHVDDILAPLVESVTDELPSALEFLVPKLPALQQLVANVIAQELQKAASAGWTSYCGE